MEMNTTRELLEMIAEALAAGYGRPSPPPDSTDAPFPSPGSGRGV
jgi:hypothetical protein